MPRPSRASNKSRGYAKKAAAATVGGYGSEQGGNGGPGGNFGPKGPGQAAPGGQTGPGSQGGRGAPGGPELPVQTVTKFTENRHGSAEGGFDDRTRQSAEDRKRRKLRRSVWNKILAGHLPKAKQLIRQQDITRYIHGTRLTAELESSRRVSKVSRSTSKRPFEMITPEDLSMGNVSIRLFFPQMGVVPALYIRYLVKHLELSARKHMRRLLSGGDRDSPANARQLKRMKSVMHTMISAARLEGTIEKMEFGNEHLYEDTGYQETAESSESVTEGMSSDEDEEIGSCQLNSSSSQVKGNAVALPQADNSGNNTRPSVAQVAPTPQTDVQPGIGYTYPSNQTSMNYGTLNNNNINNDYGGNNNIKNTADPQQQLVPQGQHLVQDALLSRGGVVSNQGGVPQIHLPEQGLQQVDAYLNNMEQQQYLPPFNTI